MQLYLVRHGQAKPKSEDPKRPLTSEGMRNVRRVAGFVSLLGVQAEVIWHSTKPRAEQTARIFATAVEDSQGLLERKDLGPNHAAGPIKEEIEQGGRDVMIVGHLPFLEKLASLLLTGDEDAGVVTFEAGGMACLRRREDGTWGMSWLVMPEML